MIRAAPVLRGHIRIRAIFILDSLKWIYVDGENKQIMFVDVIQFERYRTIPQTSKSAGSWKIFGVQNKSVVAGLSA